MIRVGIAGIGYIAEEYIKLFTAGKIHDACIAALSSRNFAHMQDIKARYSLSDTTLFSDYDVMLASGCIDMVMICTPHFFHPDMAVRAIHRGIHTLIEKPVGVLPAELDSLAACIRENPHIKTGVLYCRRCNPVFQRVKQLLDEEALGQLKRITWIVTDMYRPQCYFDSAAWRGTYSGEGGGLLMNQVSHHIDLLTWLCGLPASLQAHCVEACERTIEVENEVSITMTYPGNGIGQFIASSREYPGTNRLELSGSKGQLILEKEQTLTLRLLAQDERVFAVSTSESYGSIPFQETVTAFPPLDNTIIQAAILQNFVDALAGRAEVICSAEEAMMTQQVIMGAYLSGWQRQMLPLPVDRDLYAAELKKRMTR